MNELLKRALQLQKTGDLDEAQRLYQQRLAEDELDVNAWHLLGLLECQRGNYAAALPHFDRALELAPQMAAIHANRGVALRKMGRIDEALAAYDRAIELNPNEPDFHYNKGNLLKSRGDSVSAKLAYELAGELWIKHAIKSYHQKDYSKALTYYQKILDVFPLEPTMHCNKGVVLLKMKRLDEAEGALRAALQLAPNNAEAWSNLGVLYSERLNHAAALGFHKKSIEADPNYARGYFNYGNTLEKFGYVREAIAAFDRAVEINPNYFDAEFNRACLFLQIGRFDLGWIGYERRWQTRSDVPDRLRSKSLRTTKPVFLVDHWGAEKQSTVYVWPEQGVGDVILFGSMLEDFRRRYDVKVLCSLDPRLVQLFRRANPRVEFLDESNAVPESAYDAHLPIGSLGGYVRATCDDFDSQPIGYLKADPEKVDRFRQWLRSVAGDDVICGLSWRTASPVSTEERSVSLEVLLEGLRAPGVRFLSLQYGPVEEELGRIARSLGIEMLQCREVDCHRDLDGLAALMEACDDVVSIGNATAHLAGAMGLPVWVMLPYLAPWRWMAEGERCVWYPSARLVRQSERGNWSSVIEKVREGLQGRLADARDS